MKRYVICPIIGTGVDTDPYRGSLADVSGVTAKVQIPSNSVTGAPKYNFAFGIAQSSNFMLVEQALNVYVFPAFPLDAQMGAMEVDVMLAMNQSVEAYFLDANGKHWDMGWYSDTDSFRDVLSSVLHQIDPFIDFRTIDVPGG